MTTWSEVRASMRLDGSYERAVRRRNDARSRGVFALAWRALINGVVFLAKWGLPLLVALTATVPGWSFLMVLALALACHYVGARATKLDTFQVLRFPSVLALVLARGVRAIPWLAWSGAGLAWAAWERLTMAERAGEPAAWALIGATALVPASLAVRSAATAALDRVHPPRGSGLPGYLAHLVLWIGAWVLANRFFAPCERFVPWAALARFLSGSSDLFRPVRFARGLPFAVLDIAALVPVVSLFAARPEALADTSPVALAVCAAVSCGWLLFGGALLVRDTARSLTTCDFVTTSDSPRTPGDASVATAGLSIAARPRAGRGPWKAAWEAWRRREIVTPAASCSSTRERIFDWIAVVIGWALLLVRGLGGPALAALAVMASAKIGEPGRAAALALAAAFLSRSYVGAKLDERLHLLGVDYVVQARQEMRAVLLVAAPPTLLAAVAAAAWFGFSPAALLALAAVAAALLFRAGWPGLVSEKGRVLGCFGLVLICVAWFAFPKAPWMLTATAAAAGVLGAIGLARRLVRCDETRLRDAMRRAE